MTLEYDPIATSGDDLIAIKLERRLTKSSLLKKMKISISYKDKFLDITTVIRNNGTQGCLLINVDTGEVLQEIKDNIYSIDYLPKSISILYTSHSRLKDDSADRSAIKYVIIAISVYEFRIYKYEDKMLKLLHILKPKEFRQLVTYGNNYIMSSGMESTEIYNTEGMLIKDLEYRYMPGPNNKLFHFELDGANYIMKIYDTDKDNIREITVDKLSYAHYIITDYKDENEYLVLSRKDKKLYMFSTRTNNTSVIDIHDKSISFTKGGNNEAKKESQKVIGYIYLGNYKIYCQIEVPYEYHDDFDYMYDEEQIEEEYDSCIVDLIEETVIDTKLDIQDGIIESLSKDKFILGNAIVDNETGKILLQLESGINIFPFRTDDQILEMTDKIAKSLSSLLINYQIKKLIAKFI